MICIWCSIRLKTWTILSFYQMMSSFYPCANWLFFEKLRGPHSLFTISWYNRDSNRWVLDILGWVINLIMSWLVTWFWILSPKIFYGHKGMKGFLSLTKARNDLREGFENGKYTSPSLPSLSASPYIIYIAIIINNLVYIEEDNINA